MRGNRQRREDLGRTRALLHSIYLLGGSIVALFGVISILAVAGVPWSDPLATAVGWGLMLFVAGSIVNMAFRFLTMKLFYRCPECRGRSVKVPEALPALHYYCSTCNVEWDTGLSKGSSAYD